ncbi:septum formation family protein [Agromyces soli]
MVRAMRGCLVAALLVVVLAGCADDRGRSAGQVDGSSPATPRSSPAPAPTPVPTAAPAPEASGFEMTVGDCFDVRKDEMSRAAGLVPCEVEHDDEVYAVYELPADAAYPESSEAYFGTPFAGCIQRFEAFVGLPYEASALEITLHLPETGDWAQGDHRVWCLVYNPNDTTFGSLAGAGF